MSFVGYLIDSYNDLMINHRDPRVDDWFLMSSPFPTMGIVAFYVYFVKSLGPRLMKDRPPFDLRGAIIAYNIAQVIGSVYLVYQIMVHAWIPRYSLFCQPVDYSDDPVEVWVAHLCWWYFFCKFTEFLDTVFFVLRKKFDQITNLHVIHHSIMPLFIWWGVKFIPGGHGTFFGTLNTIVHVVMYTYYLLAALGPRFQKYLWWKKHLTTMQMVQFVIVFLHTVQVFFNGCKFPKVLAYIMCFWSIAFFALFSNFYVQAYIKRRRLPQKQLANGTKDEGKNGNLTNGYKNGNVGAITSLTNACFIGQNGLISHDKHNGYSNGNGHTHQENGYSNGNGHIIHENGYSNGNGHILQENGYSNGKSHTYKANGHSNGHSNGYSNGHSNGYSNGHSNGHSNGYSNGHSNGYSNGHSNGHSNGYSNGTSHAHENGQRNGVSHDKQTKKDL